MLFAFFRERVCAPITETGDENAEFEKRSAISVATTLESPPKTEGLEKGNVENGPSKPNHSARSLLKSASISASKCIGVKEQKDIEVMYIYGFTLFLLFVHFPLPFTNICIYMYATYNCCMPRKSPVPL